MRKTLLYITAAVILGFALVLVPLIALAEIATQYRTSFSETLTRLPESMQRLADVESSSKERPRFSTLDVEGLGISFSVALVAYALFKRKQAECKPRIIGQIPF